jgi:hypothetical protein
MLELTDSLKQVLRETADKLKGSDHRRFMAQITLELGVGGQRLAARELGWHRDLIRKGIREVERDMVCVDAVKLRGRRRTESRLPNLLDDLKSIVDRQSQTDPKFTTNRLYSRLSVAEVYRQLIAQKGYSEAELPSHETIRLRLNQLGYYPSKVSKTKPKKKLL